MNDLLQLATLGINAATEVVKQQQAAMREALEHIDAAKKTLSKKCVPMDYDVMWSGHHLDDAIDILQAALPDDKGELENE